MPWCKANRQVPYLSGGGEKREGERERKRREREYACAYSDFDHIWWFLKAKFCVWVLFLIMIRGPGGAWYWTWASYTLAEIWTFLKKVYVIFQVLVFLLFQCKYTTNQISSKYCFACILCIFVYYLKIWSFVYFLNAIMIYSFSLKNLF